MREFLMRVLLKIGWSVGAPADEFSRLRAEDAERFVPHLLPGDIVLLGNGGQLSHVAVHVGAGELVHSMATEKTMRGWLGSFRDAVMRTFGRPDRFTGVIRETLAHFLDRFERDTIVVVRAPQAGAIERDRGVTHLLTLVGRPYDYAFDPTNAAYYCTELVVEYLRSALGDGAPEVPATRRRVPLLLDRDVIEPVSVLRTPGLRVVAATPSAFGPHAQALGDALRV